MFKRIFQYAETETQRPTRTTPLQSASVVRLPDPPARGAEKSAAEPETNKPAAPHLGNFEEIYAGAEIPAPSRGYTILKVADMLDNRHLTGMPPDARRGSLMMALEAAEVEIGALLQDAVARNRALDEYEDRRLEEMKAFEAGKAEENSKLHAEMERLTSQFLTRIQANTDHVAREQDKLRAWQKRKQQESQRITDAATFCVPQGNGAANNGLTAVLERVTVRR